MRAEDSWQLGACNRVADINITLPDLHLLLGPAQKFTTPIRDELRKKVRRIVGEQQ
jgi:hypothetical protein